MHAYLKKNHPSQAELTQAMHHAAALGDDHGLQVLFQNGAKADAKGVALATKKSSQKGVGGHDFAGIYVKSVMKKLISAKTPFNKLKFTS